MLWPRWLRQGRMLAFAAALCALTAAGVSLAQTEGTTATEASPTVSGGFETPGAPAAAPEPERRPLYARHWFKGLLCASFLLMCGLAGANDRPQGDSPASEKPPQPQPPKEPEAPDSPPA